ncbi:hypothetical protein [Pseudonocardia spirodelae]|uniref:DUF11 domain-containing protein n=1 Tax=Pseudonocardia spirodelae TaxID=3133431 RepID=A0ABU8T9E8_9PSEU
MGELDEQRAGDVSHDELARPSRAGRRATSHERRALLMSALALAAAVVGTAFSGAQTLVATQSLRDAQRLFDAAGPQLRVTSKILVWNDATPQDVSHLSTDTDPVVPVTDPGRESYLYVQLQNVGREPTTIVDIAYDVGLPRPWRASDLSPPGQTYNGCSITGIVGPGVEPPRPCSVALPHTLEPGTIYTVTLYLPVTASTLPTSCPEGVTTRIDAVGVAGSPVTHLARFRPR